MAKSYIERDKTKMMLIEKYIECLKSEQLPWIKGWDNLHGNHNGISNREYRGKNALLLSIVAAEFGYKDKRWFTFNQIKTFREQNNIEGPMFSSDAKGQGVPITYYGVYSIELKRMMNFDDFRKLVKAKSIDPQQCRVLPFKTYTVFNGDLINGLEPEITPEKENISLDTRIAKAIENMKVGFSEKGNKAFYSPSTDEVVVPPGDSFISEEFFYSTVLHELCHASGHSSRLNRETITNGGFFGSESYAKEELNAEIASSFICASLGIKMDDTHITNHAAYIQSWISVLEKEPETLIKAIDIANGIEDYILSKAELQIDSKDLDATEHSIKQAMIKIGKER